MLESYQKETHEILVPLRGTNKYNTELYYLRNLGRRAIEKMKIETPSLLIALRADPEMYEEALESYYRINTFRLTRLAVAAIDDDLSEKTLNSVRKIIVDR